MLKRFLIFLLIILFIPLTANADYLVGGTQNYPLSIDPDLGSSDTTVSSQNAVYTYITNNCAPVNGYLVTTKNVPSLTNSTNLGAFSTGMLKVTVSGGQAVLSIGVPGVDFATSCPTATYASLSSHYLMLQNDSTLPNSFNLGSLSSGLIKITVSGGVAVPSVAVEGVDYLTTGSLIGVNTNLTYWASFMPSSDVKTLLNEANIAAIKAFLGYYTSGDTISGTFMGNLTGNVTGNSSTATALAQKGTNCSAGYAPLGIDVSGNAYGCWLVPTGGGGGGGSVDLSSPGTIGGTTPGIGYFSLLYANKYNSNSTDGSRYANIYNTASHHSAPSIGDFDFMGSPPQCYFYNGSSWELCVGSGGGGGGTGTIIGSTGFTDKAIVTANGTGGATIEGSPCTIAADGTMTCPGNPWINFSTAASTPASSWWLGEDDTTGNFWIGTGNAYLTGGLISFDTSGNVNIPATGLIIFIIYYSIQFFNNTHSVNDFYPFILNGSKQFLLDLFYSTGKQVILFHSVIDSLGVLWFLPSLFSAIIIFYFFLKLFEKYSVAVQSIIIILLALAGYMIGKHVLLLPWSIDISLVAQIFMFSGYLMQKYRIFEKKSPIWLLAAAAGIWILDLYMGGINMSEREYNNPAVSTIGAIAASYLIMKLSCFLSKSASFYYRAISYIGRQSLVILCFHQLDTFVCAPIIIRYSALLWLYQNNLWIILTGVRVSCSLLIAEIIKRLPLVKSVYYPKMSSIIGGR